ncbi:MAG: transglycosylase SLT domain-containing protein [Gammaproteobacteria bacterium]|nr:transglycosylase SLT domain-containing protein [Gammaproteobacteria bacterium]
MTKLLTVARISALLGVLASVAAQAADLDQQRELFRAVYADVERGSWQQVDDLTRAEHDLLQRYVLWPDLRATWLKANIKQVPAVEVDTFLLKYGTLKPARELRYRYALNAVRDGDLGDYLHIYQQFYQGQDIASLDCLALQAELDAGRPQRVIHRAIDLWTVGRSQVKECDPVFKYLGTKHLLGDADYRKRYALAIEAREFALARWLGKKIDAAHVETATQWQQAQANPEDFLRSRHRGNSDTLRAQLAYATERLTYRDPEIAHELWNRLLRTQPFSEKQKLLSAQHIALWTARDNLPGAYSRLNALPPAAQNIEVLRWRARVSLRSANWNNLLVDISLMDPAEKSTEEWRYWRAVALHRSGQVLAAREELELLSGERSYYGFLAADELGKEYALGDSRLLVNETMIAAIEARPSIVRARELFLVGQDGRGRSEWDAVIRYLSDEEQMQAAILADRWGWHSRAIATAARLGEYDDLALRYPLPYQTSFEASSTRASIAPTWAYGIARSESLFMRDIRSSAGAVGLMQLMPATGRDVAKELRLPYSGLTTLTHAETNIRLGTTYLGKMSQRYGGNQVLATAAYNAGPHRVDRWLPEAGNIDARIWIENIPFNETRKYVKRVLAAQAIFHWRLTGQVRRLSDELLQVRPAASEPQVAQR